MLISDNTLTPSINSAEEQRNLQEHIQSFGEYQIYNILEVLRPQLYGLFLYKLQEKEKIEYQKGF